MAHFSDGETIFRQGASDSVMYTIKSGKVRIFRVQDGQETTLAILKPGEFFGEMALFESKPRSASAQAIGPTELEGTSRDEFKTMVGNVLVWDVLQSMSARIREVDEDLEKLSTDKTKREQQISHLTINRSRFV